MSMNFLACMLEILYSNIILLKAVYQMYIAMYDHNNAAILVIHVYILASSYGCTCNAAHCTVVLLFVCPT